MQVSPQQLLREYIALDGYRKGDGVTPLQYQRWLDLGRQLAGAFPDRPLTVGGETRMLVDYKSPSHLLASIMRDVRPVGLFVDTLFVPERGTRLVLNVSVGRTDETYASSVVVVSNNVGPNFSTLALGMGVRFQNSTCPLRTLLEQLDRPA